MPTYSINTAEDIDHLVESGMPAAPAKAVLQTIAESQDQLVTKSDLELFKAELARRFDSHERKMIGCFDSLRREMDARLDRTKIWIVSAILLAVGVFKALDYILPAIGL